LQKYLKFLQIKRFKLLNNINDGLTVTVLQHFTLIQQLSGQIIYNIKIVQINIRCQHIKGMKKSHLLSIKKWDMVNKTNNGNNI